MEHEVRVTYTIEIIKTSVKQQWINLIGTSGFVLLIFLLVAFPVLVLLGVSSWLLGFFAAMLIIYAGIIIFGYFRLLSFSMTKFRRMESPTATFRFTDEGISVVADTGKTEIVWKLVDKVLQTPKVWVILVAGGSITLPIDSLDDDLKEFILGKAEQ